MQKDMAEGRVFPAGACTRAANYLIRVFISLGAKVAQEQRPSLFYMPAVRLFVMQCHGRHPLFFESHEHVARTGSFK